MVIDRRADGFGDYFAQVSGCYPKEIREKLGLTPGQKVQTIIYEDRIELIPVRPIKKMKGFLKGLDTTVQRDED